MRVPSQYQPAFLLLRDLPDNEYQRLVGALKVVQPTISVTVLAERLVDGAGRTTEELEALINALASFAGNRRSQTADAAIVARSVASSEDFETSGELVEAFAARIQATSETSAIRLLGKAVDLGSEHDKVFLGARVFTDLRPIFGDDADNGPEGAILSHELKFEFVHDEGHLGSFYVVLDEEDIETLALALERAQAKAASLKGVLERAGLTYMGTEGTE